MTPPRTNLKQDIGEIQTQILFAALERFQQYGYGKTTMAEIAADCGMSASNLYRFFENKQDIGAALATDCLGQQRAAIEIIVNNISTNAGKRLEECILAMLHHTHHHCSRLPRLVEMVDAICEHRTDIVISHRRSIAELFEALLRQGEQSGDFTINNLSAAADAILSATVIFDAPHFMKLHSLEEFEIIAGNLATLLVNGLQRRT